MPICEKCGKEHDGTFGSGRFCSRSCANSKIHTDATKKKIGLGVANSEKVGHKEAEYLKNPKYCISCGKMLGYRNKSGYCSSCYVKLPHSEESKKKQSNTMKEKGYMRWHIHRDEPSFAEKFFMNVLQNNGISYTFEKKVPNEKHYFYILDFYIERNDAKIDLEIDGQQHEDPDRAKHDYIRDRFLVNAGYNVYRIKWNNITSEDGKAEMKQKIDSFLSFLNSL